MAVLLEDKRSLTWVNRFCEDDLLSDILIYMLMLSGMAVYLTSGYMMTFTPRIPRDLTADQRQGRG